MAEKFDSDIRELKTVLSRVEVTVEKLTAVSQQLSELMSVQVSKFNEHERRLSDVQNENRELRHDIQELREEVSSLNTELKVAAAHVLPLRKGAWGLIATISTLLVGAIMAKVFGGKLF